MKRDCDACGRRYSARSRQSKYCSDVECRRRRERERDRRRRGVDVAEVAEVVELPARSRQRAAGGILGAARVELDAAGRADTSLGRAALALAARLDDCDGDTGSSAAALAREYRATLAEAVRGAVTELDDVDELRARRDRRRA